jgi:hypothetical protein
MHLQPCSADLARLLIHLIFCKRKITQEHDLVRKRGRPRLDAAERRSEPVGVRLTPQLRNWLDEARDGRPLTAEILARLSASFTSERDFEQRLGGFATARLLVLVAKAIRAIETRGGGEHWLNSRFTYEQVREMLNVLLDHLAPRGRRALPKLLRRLPPSFAKDIASIGRQEALKVLTLLKAVNDEPRPDVLPPVDIYRAALPLGRRVRGAPVDELSKLKRQTQPRPDPPSLAIVARGTTVGLLTYYLHPRLAPGAKMPSLAKIFAGTTGRDIGKKTPLIVKRIEAATKGRLKIPLKTERLTEILTKAAAREPYDVAITTKQHQEMQRRALQQLSRDHDALDENEAMAAWEHTKVLERRNK